MITIGLVKIIIISIIIIFAIIFIFIAIKSIVTQDWNKKYIDFKEGDEEKDFRIVYREHPYFEIKYYFIDKLKKNWLGKKYWEVEGWDSDICFHQEYFFTFKEAEEYLKKEYLDVSRKEDDKKIYYSKRENKSSDNDNDFWLKFARGSVLFENLKEEKKMEE